MIFYDLLRLFCKNALAKLLSKCKEFMLTSIDICSQKLRINHFLMYCVHVLLCTLMNKYIICGMSLVFRLMNNVLTAC